MKILIATGIFPPDIGGPATYSKKIVEEMTNQNHKVIIITYYDRSKSEIRNFAPPVSGVSASLRKSETILNYLIFKISRNWPVFLKYFLYFLKVLWYGRGTDLIYLQDPVSAGLPTTLANLFLRKRLVLKIVGDYAWESLRRGDVSLDEFYPFKLEKYPLKIWLFKTIQTWVAGRTDKIITPSEYLKGIVEKWGIKEDKIQVIYNAFSKSESRILYSSRWLDEPNRPNPENKDNKYFTIISVGRLVPWKGYDGLIEVFSELGKVYPNLRLKIIGTGPQMPNIQFLISKFQLQEKVQLLGSLPHEESLKEMAGASLFVLNTAYEGLSHVLLEALAVGTPVVTTSAGGNPEVIRDGWNGILVTYNNQEELKTAIKKMIEDKNFREMCVKNGFVSLEKFSEERMINKTLQVLTHR